MLWTRDGVGEVQAQLDLYLEKLPVRADAVVVTGSRARGTHMRDSDIDLVVVSEELAGLNRGQRIELLLEPYRDLPPLEPAGYTPEEVLHADGLYLWDALADGRPRLDSGLWQQAREAFLARIAAGELERTERGWRQPRGAS